MSADLDGQRPVESDSDKMIGYFVLDEIYHQLTRFVQEYPFLKEERPFKQILMAFEETRREEAPDLEEIRAIHQGLVSYLEGIDPQKGGAQIIGIVGEGRARRGRKLQIPKELRNFDAIVTRIEAQRKDESLLESYDSAVDSLVLGEISLHQVVFTHRMEVRERVLELLAETEIDEFTEAELKNEDIIQTFGANEAITLLDLTDEQLTEGLNDINRDVVRIILEARNAIRRGDSHGAQDPKTRLEEAIKLTYKEDDREEVMSIVPKLSLEDMERVLTPEEMRVLVMRTGKRAPNSQRIGFEGDEREIPLATRQTLDDITRKTLKKLREKREALRPQGQIIRLCPEEAPSDE